MVSYTSGSSSKSSSSPFSNLPWRETRGLMGRAEKRFVEPLLTGDWSAPGVQDVMNLARGETTKAQGEMFAKLSALSGVSGPAKAKMMSDAMAKVSELAAGVGIKTINELKAWFEKVTGSMGQVASSSQSGGTGGGVSWPSISPSSTKKTE